MDDDLNQPAKLPPNPWQRLVAASAPDRDPAPKPVGDQAPPGFSAAAAARWSRFRIPPDATAWERFAAFARPAALGSREGRCHGETPFGFPARVAARWKAEAFPDAHALWFRWSWRGLACSLVLLSGIMLAGLRSDQARTETALLPAPPLDLPLPLLLPAPAFPADGLH